jgi:hypothetical protein
LGERLETWSTDQMALIKEEVQAEEMLLEIKRPQVLDLAKEEYSKKKN